MREKTDEMALLGERIAETSAMVDYLTHSLLADLRAFDAGEGWRAQGALSCAHWLAWRTGIELGAAREKVRVARALGDLPAIDAALKRAELSYSKVRAMTRVASAGNEQQLVELARTSTAAQLERTCRRARQQRPDAAVEERWLRVKECDDGTLLLQVKVSADEAELILQACRVSAETPVQGLLAMADRTLRGGSTDAETQKPPVEVVVHIDAATLAGHTDSGHGVSAETSRRLLCDAGVVPVLEDSAGRLVDAGRKRRTISPALRRARHATDGGCRFPGCTHRLVDIHHLRHWLDGGETTLDNTLSLCRRHHGLLHEAGFTIERTADHLVFRDPAGWIIPPAPLPRVVATVPA